jgi:G3E family GTPase
MDVINAAERQIAVADRIIINKRDLVTEEELEELKRVIKSINSVSPLFITERSRVPLDSILEINAFDMEKVAKQLHLEDNRCEDHKHEHPNHHHHDSGVITVSFTVPGIVDIEKFTAWIGELLWEQTDDVKIYRCKGLLATQSQSYVLQVSI